MSASDFWLRGWDWEPSVVAGCAALAIGYLALMRRWQKGTWFFLGGVVLLLLDLVSPLDLLGDRYLFSAHILQHFVLALIIPPLLIMGLPRGFEEHAQNGSRPRRPDREFLYHMAARLPRVNPPLAWVLGVGTMVVWHIPVFFNAALADDALHIAQHLSFLITGTLFWWPVFDPVEERRLPPLTGISYLFGACLTCSVLGAALTFARPGLYPAYLNPQDGLGLLPLIRDAWGLDPKTDQQLGGLLMWVPGCFVYLSAILMTVAHWYGMKERTA